VSENALITCGQNGFNVIATPHIGGYADSAVHATRRLIVEVFAERVTSA
jgi:lactate dehydrogenase-like 2-hydroxyacid dehydrogenase